MHQKCFESLGEKKAIENFLLGISKDIALKQINCFQKLNLNSGLIYISVTFTATRGDVLKEVKRKKSVGLQHASFYSINVSGRH